MNSSKKQPIDRSHERVVVQGTRVLDDNELDAVSGGAIGALPLTPAVQKVRSAV
jgi:hypothetical protein